MNAITLSDAMVQLLLQGITVKSRRPLEPQPTVKELGEGRKRLQWGYGALIVDVPSDGRMLAQYAPYEVGEVLAVREAYRLTKRHGATFVECRATVGKPRIKAVNMPDALTSSQWQVPNAMPEWATMLRVKVVSVDVDRLEGIWFWVFGLEVSSELR